MCNLSTGFNGDAAKDLLIKLNNNYGQFLLSSYSDVVQKYITPISENWASEEAYDFFNQTFAPEMNKIYSDASEMYFTINETVNIAGTEWANFTGNPDAFKNIELDLFATNNNKAELTTEIEVIKKENASGAKGINIQEVQNLTKILDDCFSTAISTLEELRGYVSNTEFLGGGQSEELMNSLETLKKNISSSLEKIKGTMNQKVFETIANYSNLQKNTENSFEIDAANIDFSRITTTAASALGSSFMSEDRIQKQYWGDNSSGKLS